MKKKIHNGTKSYSWANCAEYEPLCNVDVDTHWNIKALCDDILYFVKFFTNVNFLLFVRWAMFSSIFGLNRQFL